MERNVLDTIHKLVNHQGYLKIQSKVDEYKFYWKGIKNDIYSILNLCDTRIQKKEISISENLQNKL